VFASGIRSDVRVRNPNLFALLGQVFNECDYAERLPLTPLIFIGIATTIETFAARSLSE
jgi:hypothetical protein